MSSVTATSLSASPSPVPVAMLSTSLRSTRTGTECVGSVISRTRLVNCAVSTTWPSTPAESTTAWPASTPLSVPLSTMISWGIDDAPTNSATSMSSRTRVREPSSSRRRAFSRSTAS